MHRSIATACLAWALLSTSAWAQYPSSVTGAGGATGRSSSGMFGSSRTVGGGSISAGQRTFSSGAQGQGTLQQLGANAGQLTGSERYIRGNRQAGAFVGGDTGDTAFVGAVGSGAAGGGFGGLGGSGLQGMGNNRGQFGQTYGNNYGNNRNRQRQNTRMIRTTLSLGFTAPSANRAVASRRLTGLLQRSGRFPSTVEVLLVGRTAVLRGTVSSDDDRGLVEQVVLLEPGISQVENELVVAAREIEELPALPETN